MSTAIQEQRSFTSAKLDWLTALSADPRLDARAFEVGFCIVQHMNANSERSIVSDDAISDKTGIPKRWVLRARQSLKEAGWIDWQRTGMANVYSILRGRIDAVTERQLVLKEMRTNKRKARKSMRPWCPKEVPPVAQQEVPPVTLQETPPVANIHLRNHTFSTTPSKTLIPDADASGPSGLNSGFERSRKGDAKPRPPYRQTKAEADRALRDLRQMDFRTEWDDPDYALNARSERGVIFHWHRLLRAGHATETIVDTAARVVSMTAENQRPSLGAFLARYESWLDDDQPGDDDGSGQTMFDLARQFERRVREHQSASGGACR
jgi:hypothetical protein